MYCGDDVEAVVGDVGTGLSKFGLAGEDTPQLVLPSVVGRRPPPAKDSKDTSTSFVLGDLWHRHDLEVLRPVEACAVANWDALEKVWSYAFERLHVDSKSHPVITSAASCFANDALHNAASRDAEKYLEMMFETFQVPAFYMAKDAVLDAFAFGRSLALVAEIGAGASRVVPVYDGYALERPAQYSSVGCNQLSEYLDHLVTNMKESVVVRPRGTFTRKTNLQGVLETIPLVEKLTTPPVMPASYLKFSRADLFRDMREATCMMSETALEEHRDASGQDQTASSPEPVPLEITEQQYELPDGQTVVLGKERYEVPEFLLYPKNFGGAVLKTEQHAAAAAKVVAKGLDRMLYDAVQLCDADLRRDMLTNIILCGGGSLTPGITERLHAELTRMVPSTFKVRFTTVTKIERQFSVFIGGSILASLGSFQQLSPLVYRSALFDEDAVLRHVQVSKTPPADRPARNPARIPLFQGKLNLLKEQVARDRSSILTGRLWLTEKLDSLLTPQLAETLSSFQCSTRLPHFTTMSRSGYQVTQNVDNFLRDKPSTRLHAPPGGGSSVGSLIFGGGDNSSPFAGHERHSMRRKVESPELSNPYAKDNRRGGYNDTPSNFNQPAIQQAQPSGRAGASSNQYASGSNQNCGNVLTDRRITRIHAPPGGVSQIRFG